MLTATFPKKALGKNPANVIGTRGSYSTKSRGWTSCFLSESDLLFPLRHQGFFFLLCLFLWRSGGGWTCCCFLGLHSVTRVHPSSSSLGMFRISFLASTSVVGTINGSTTCSKLPNCIVTNSSFSEGAKSQCSHLNVPWLVLAALSKSRIIVPSLANCIICSLSVMHFSRGWLMNLWYR